VLKAGRCLVGKETVGLSWLHGTGRVAEVTAIYTQGGPTLRSYRLSCFLDTNCYVFNNTAARFRSFQTVIREPVNGTSDISRDQPKISYFFI
jgi:hypothetical protein